MPASATIGAGHPLDIGHTQRPGIDPGPGKGTADLHASGIVLVHTNRGHPAASANTIG